MNDLVANFTHVTSTRCRSRMVKVTSYTEKLNTSTSSNRKGDKNRVVDTIQYAGVKSPDRNDRYVQKDSENYNDKASTEGISIVQPTGCTGQKTAPDTTS